MDVDGERERERERARKSKTLSEFMYVGKTEALEFEKKKHDNMSTPQSLVEVWNTSTLSHRIFKSSMHEQTPKQKVEARTQIRNDLRRSQKIDDLHTVQVAVTISIRMGRETQNSRNSCPVFDAFIGHDHSTCTITEQDT